MTVLAGYQGNGFAIIAGDSRATDEWGRISIMANPKISYSKSGQYIYATTGTCRGGNLIQQGFTPPDAPVWVDIEHLDEFMTQTFIPALRAYFIDEGYDAKDDGEAATNESDFLIAVSGVIYQIYNDYSWVRDARNIYYDGSGGEVVLGAMTALGIDKCKNDRKKARAIMKKAIEITCQWNAYCAPPVVIETQLAK